LKRDKERQENELNQTKLQNLKIQKENNEILIKLNKVEDALTASNKENEWIKKKYKWLEQDSQRAKEKPTTLWKDIVLVGLIGIGIIAQSYLTYLNFQSKSTTNKRVETKYSTHPDQKKNLIYPGIYCIGSGVLFGCGVGIPGAHDMRYGIAPSPFPKKKTDAANRGKSDST